MHPSHRQHPGRYQVSELSEPLAAPCGPARRVKVFDMAYWNISLLTLRRIDWPTRVSHYVQLAMGSLGYPRRSHQQGSGQPPEPHDGGRARAPGRKHVVQYTSNVVNNEGSDGRSGSSHRTRLCSTSGDLQDTARALLFRCAQLWGGLLGVSLLRNCVCTTHLCSSSFLFFCFSSWIHTWGLSTRHRPQIRNERRASGRPTPLRGTKQPTLGDRPQKRSKCSNTSKPRSTQTLSQSYRRTISREYKQRGSYLSHHQATRDTRILQISTRLPHRHLSSLSC
jgi:hypothetical protein